MPAGALPKRPLISNNKASVKPSTNCNTVLEIPMINVTITEFQNPLSFKKLSENLLTNERI